MSEIEGNMAYSAESSDSEPEEDVVLCTSETPPAETIAINFDQEEEEEVEYFGRQKPPIVANSSNNAQAESKLASILFQKAPASESTSLARDGVKDEFGIEYHSKRKPQGAGAMVPSALDDFDEDLVNRMLVAPNSSQPSNEEEDEFDLEFDENIQSQNAELIAKALENASILAQSSGADSTGEALTATTTATTDTTAIVKSDNENSTKTSMATSIMEEARKALAEVAEVYGSGLGDQEVLQLTTGSAQNDNNSAIHATLDLKVCGAIEEGDEEEEELQEVEEEQRREATMRMQQAQEQQLESEWDVLQHSNSTSSHTHSYAETAFDSNGEPVRVVSMKEMAKVWTFDHAVSYFQAMDHSSRLPLIVVHEDTKGGWFSTAPKPLSYPGCKEDLNLPFLIAQVDYDPQCSSHWQMLSTLYTFFIRGVGESELTLTTSKNWERLGFQGSDPRTDLNRSMKMLSVLQMLSFIELDRGGAMRAFELSMSNCIAEAGAAPTSIAERNARAKDDMSWPFMCVAIMFTKEALQALRKGVFNEKIMKRQSVFSVLNEFHRACFAEFERMLLLEPHKHHAVHLASLRKLCESSPLKLLKRHKGSAPSSPSKTPRSPAPAPAPATTAPTRAALPVTEEFHFDELGALDDKDDVKDDTEPPVNGTNGDLSSWSASIFGSKASKFAV